MPRLRRFCRSSPGWAGLGAAGLALVLAGCNEADYPQSIFRPVTHYGVVLNQLFENTFWWTMLLLAIVWVVLVYCIIRYRARPGAPEPKHIHGNTKLELTWSIGPAIIVAFIAVPTIKTIFATQAPAPPDALTIEVIGHQWWWEFRYPEYGVVTANEVHMPVGRPIDLTMRSADVIHSFWIPRLGGKRDVNPLPAPVKGEAQHPNHIVFTVDSAGYYPGQCAEFCGHAHAVMRMAAIAQDSADFAAWIQRMKTPAAPAPGSLAAKGEKVFTSHVCMACHTINGTSARGVIGPNLTRVGERRTITGVLPMSVANLEKWITHPAAVKPGAKMPGIHYAGGGIPPTNLTQDQLEAVATYLYGLGAATHGPAADTTPVVVFAGSPAGAASPATAAATMQQ